MASPPTASPCIDPFNDRLAREIRNKLSRLFVRQALQQHGAEAPLTELARHLTGLPRCGASHREYIETRLAHYRPILRQVAQGPGVSPLQLAVRLWNAGLFFECHEALETWFHSLGGARRQAVQGWIQAAGCYLHHQAGHPDAARRLAAKASVRLQQLEPFLSGVPELLRDLEAGGVAPPPLTLGPAAPPDTTRAALSSPTARRVQQTLHAAGFTCQVRELAASTRTAAEAAAAVGCQVSQIVKSLVLVGRRSGQLLLVVASGANRLDLAAIGRHLGEPVALAKAEVVRARTGFAIGGVPPLGHREPMRVLVDVDLLSQAEIWAAAGTPHALFRLTPAELLAMTAGEPTAVKGYSGSPAAAG
jgi:prolyl-tRNA editing enzyme YbaK/EbsC (Cys-tRNA(Pro) deacylase)